MFEYFFVVVTSTGKVEMEILACDTIETKTMRLTNLTNDINEIMKSLNGTDGDKAQAIAVLQATITQATDLLNETHISENGAGLSSDEWWAAQTAHDAFFAAIATAQAFIDAIPTQTLNVNVSIGSRYEIPISVKNMPLPTSFTLIFDPAKINFYEMTQHETISPLPSDPENGMVAFSYHGFPSANDPTYTGIVNSLRFTAVSSGDTTILVIADESFTLMDTVAYENTTDNFGFAENKRDTAKAILTSTLREAIGMQGFEGEYAIDSQDEIIEIIVQFVTPPSVALRLMQEKGIVENFSFSSRTSYEEQALAGHTAFNRQLNEITNKNNSVRNNSYEIFSEHHSLFNGVFMRVPASMVTMIADLPEVFAVFPNVKHYVDPIPYNNDSENFIKSRSNFPHNNEARELFNIDYIHNTLGFTGEGIKVAVLDTGVNYNHPDLIRYQDPATGKIRGWNFFADNDDTMDFGGHGTHVSGTVVAMAPDVELWHYRVLGGTVGGAPGSFTMNGIEAAHAEGVDIINFSIGAPPVPGSPVNAYVYTPVTYMFNLATLDGIVCVMSAGNYRTEFPFRVSLYGTAALPIIVGAGTAGGKSQTLDTISITSSPGPVPGTYHIKPDIVAPGVDIYSTFLGNLHVNWSGTSMAAPAIAGIAALMLNAFPDAEPWEIKARLMNTARPLADVNLISVFDAGAGFVRPIEALTSHTIVTAEHPVPSVESSTEYAEFQITMPHIPEKMPSLSFGSVDPYNNTMPLEIENRSPIDTAPKTYTISYAFNHNPDNAASLSFCRTNITVAAGGIGNIIVTLNFGDEAPTGFYEGYVFVSTEGEVVARLPFAAHLTETVRPVVTVATPFSYFNGTSFEFEWFQIIASDYFRGNSVLVVAHKYTADGRISNIRTNVELSAGRLMHIMLDSTITPFLPQNGEYIELRVYRNSIRQHLLLRKFVKPVVFSFN
jgi:subtilisin family serine protease